MKIIELLTDDDKMCIIDGHPRQFFQYLSIEHPSFSNMIPDLCVEYFLARSGEKTISIGLEKILELSTKFNRDSSRILANLLNSKFADKWNKVMYALTDTYNPLDSIDVVDTKTGNNTITDSVNKTLRKQGTNSDTINYGHSTTKEGNNTDTTTYDTRVEDDGNTSTKETTTRSTDDSNSVYGYNSVNAVPESKSSSNLNETVEGESNDNKTHNVQTKLGTDTKDIDIDETETHSGTDTKTLLLDETETNSGTDTKDVNIDESNRRKGRTENASSLVEGEINLRNKRVFFDIVLSDIDSILALQIYI